MLFLGGSCSCESRSRAHGMGNPAARRDRTELRNQFLRERRTVIPPSHLLKPLAWPRQPCRCRANCGQRASKPRGMSLFPAAWAKTQGRARSQRFVNSLPASGLRNDQFPPNANRLREHRFPANRLFAVRIPANRFRSNRLGLLDCFAGGPSPVAPIAGLCTPYAR